MPIKHPSAQTTQTSPRVIWLSHLGLEVECFAFFQLYQTDNLCCAMCHEGAKRFLFRVLRPASAKCLWSAKFEIEKKGTMLNMTRVRTEDDSVI